MNLSVLVHTFDGYKHLWPGFFEAFHNHFGYEDCQYFFGTDIETDFVPSKKYDFNPDWEKIYSGPGEWSDRLRRLIAQIPTDYILYFQEDHYLTSGPPDAPYYPMPDLDSFVGYIMPQKDIQRLQLSPINQFYSLTGSELPLFFHKSSKYLVSHQPSIWRKDFLLSCLEPGESPWVNEYEGTKRLQKRDITGKIAIYPCDWYKHMCVKGQVQE